MKNFILCFCGFSLIAVAAGCQSLMEPPHPRKEILCAEWSKGATADKKQKSEVKQKTETKKKTLKRDRKRVRR